VTERLMTSTAPEIRLGLRENWPQFALLVVINAFVGGMVGIERTVVPLIGTEIFHIGSTAAIVTFIVSFGLVKACANLISGYLADAYGRKIVLIAGWLVGLPVPLLLAWGPDWTTIVIANALLGLNQGLTWSMTVVMKVDLVGPKSRGLAVGLNEFAGYLTLGLTALLTGYLAQRYGLRPEPFYPGIAYAILGLALSALLVRDTLTHVRLESMQQAVPAAAISFRDVFLVTSFRDRNLFAASQAGLVNNLNDGMSWGIFPLFFATFGLSVERIGILKAVYPVVWGLLQTITGPLSDRWGRKGLIVAGMWVQAAALIVTGMAQEFTTWLVASMLLGLGTAMVYPTLIAAVSDASHPSWRARSLSIYRFWRDIGYAVGALMAGLIADTFGAAAAIITVGALTFLSGAVVAVAMQPDSRRR
jgi:MFS family permease